MGECSNRVRADVQPALTLLSRGKVCSTEGHSARSSRASGSPLYRDARHSRRARPGARQNTDLEQPVRPHLRAPASESPSGFLFALDRRRPQATLRVVPLLVQSCGPGVLASAAATSRDCRVAEGVADLARRTETEEPRMSDSHRTLPAPLVAASPDEAYYLQGEARDLGHETRLSLDASAYADRWDVVRRVNIPARHPTNPVVMPLPFRHIAGCQSLSLS